MTVVEFPQPDGLSPTERTLWLIRTDAKVRDHIARRLWRDDNALRETTAVRLEWEALPEGTRGMWGARAIARYEEYADLSPAEQREADRASLADTLARNNAAFEDDA